MSSLTYTPLGMEGSSERKSTSNTWLVCGCLSVVLCLCLVAALVCMVTYLMLGYQYSQSLTDRIVLLEQNYSRLQYDYDQLQSRFANETQLSALKTQTAINSVKLTLQGKLEIVNKSVENVRYKVEAIDSNLADVSNRLLNLSQNVSVRFQSVAQELGHITVTEMKQVHLMRKSVIKGQDHSEMDIIQLKREMKNLKKEQLSLRSQVHHPVTAFSNCRTDVHNSTCRMNSTTAICLTERVLRQVEVRMVSV